MEFASAAIGRYKKNVGFAVSDNGVYMLSQKDDNKSGERHFDIALIHFDQQSFNIITGQKI